MDCHKIVIQNLNLITTSCQLNKLCSNFGLVLKAQILKDPVLLRPKGSAVVVMNCFNDALRCIDELNGRLFLGKKISVAWARGKLPMM